VTLLVISPGFLAALVIVSVALLGLAVWRATRHRWVSTTGLGVLAVTMSLLTAADFVNAHYAFLPRVADVLGFRTWPSAKLAEVTSSIPARLAHPRGAVVSVRLPGTVSGFGSPKAMVYVPPQYFTEPSRRFPVVYLLHGSPGAPIDWFRAARAEDAGLAAARAGHPVILVAPRVGRNWSDDSECVDRPSEHIATYVVRDVIRDVDARFRTIPDRDARAVAGNSAGGYCALNLGLRHRDRFSAIVDMSGFNRPTHEGGMRALFGNRPDLAAVVAANTPRDYAKTLSPPPDVRLWLDCGMSDSEARRDTVAMADVLAARGFDVNLRLRKGGHDYDVWRPALIESVSWAAAGFDTGPGPGS
jgi:enterochelin esterase-like enzyme